MPRLVFLSFKSFVFFVTVTSEDACCSMRNVKKILDCCSKPCVVHVLCLLPLLAFYFLLNSVDAQNQRCSYGNGAALLVFKLLAYGRTDSHMTTKIFQIDGLPNFLRHGAPLARQELRYNWNNRQPHTYAMRTYFLFCSRSQYS